MQIIPVLYILDGQCVSLYKGDLRYKTTYPSKATSYAREFASHGFKKLLIVDLNATAEHKMVNTKLIQEIIAENPSTEVQYTGGLRTVEEVDKAFNELKIAKVIIGISGLTILPTCIKKFGPDKVYSGVKAYGKDIISSALDKPYEVFDFAQELSGLGVRNFFYHDIFSEGTLIHPNYDEVERVIKTTDLNVFIGGGISKIKHLNLLRQIGVKGAYIGRAFMEGLLDYDEVEIFEKI